MRFLMAARRLVTSSILFASLGACSNIHITKEQTDSIRSVAIASSVSGKSTIDVIGGQVNVPSGVFSTSINLNKEGHTRRLGNHLNEHGIVINKLVMQEFRKKLLMIPSWGGKLAEEGSAESIFRLEIAEFNLWRSYNGYYYPSLKLVGTLEDGNGRILWVNSAEIGNLDFDIPRRKFDEYLVGDEPVRNIVSKAVVKLVKSLEKQAINGD